MDKSNNENSELGTNQEQASTPDRSTQYDDADQVVDHLKRLVAEVSSNDSVAVPKIDRFVLLDILSDHGVASVYLAHDPELDRKVVIKVFPSSLTEKLAERVRNEGRALSKIDNPYVAKCFDVGEYDGQMFLVLEFVPGSNLSQLIVERRFDYSTCLDLVDQVANGLAAVHRCGLLHRDIKPSNILITPSGDAKLIDFGLAEPFESKEIFNRSGTPAYMAPERANGQLDQIDQRSDIFGLGAVLYHLLAWRPPFAGRDNTECLNLARQGQIQPAKSIRAEIPKRVSELCMKALRYRADERFQDIDEFRSAIRSLKNHQAKLRVLAVAVSLFVVGLVGVAIASNWGKTSDPGVVSRSEGDYNSKLTSQNLNEFVANAFNQVHIKGEPHQLQSDFEIKLEVVEGELEKPLVAGNPDAAVLELYVEKDYQIRVTSSQDCYLAIYGFNGEATEGIELFELISPLSKEQFFVKKDTPFDVPLGLAVTAAGKLDRFYLIASDRFWPPDEVHCVGNKARVLERSGDAERRWGIERGGKNEKVTTQNRPPQVIAERIVDYRVVPQGTGPETREMKQARKQMLDALDSGEFQLAWDHAVRFEERVKAGLADYPSHPWHRTISVELDLFKQIGELDAAERKRLAKAFEVSAEAEQLFFDNQFVEASRTFAKSARAFDSILGKGTLFAIRDRAQGVFAATEQRVEDRHVRQLKDILNRHVELLGKNHVETLEVKRLLAQLFNDSDSLHEIREFYNKHDFEVHHVPHTWVTFNLSLAYERAIDFSNSSLLMTEAKRLAEKCDGGDSVMVAVIYKELARLEHNHRNYGLADKYLQRASDVGTLRNQLRTRPEDRHADTALMAIFEFLSHGFQARNLYWDLSDEEKKENLKKSLTYAQQAADMAKAIYGEESWIYSNVLSNLGEANFRNDKIENALEEFQESLRIYIARTRNQGPKLPDFQYDVAKCYSKLKQYEKCNQWLRKVIASAKRFQRSSTPNSWETITTWKAYRTIGINYQLMGDLEKAYPKFIASMDSSLERFSDSYNQMSDDQLRAYSENLRVTANLLAASTDPDNPDRVRESFMRILQSKGLMSTQMVKRNKVFSKQPSDGSEEAQKQRRELVDHQLLVSKLGMQRLAADDAPSISEGLMEARATVQQLEQSLLVSTFNKKKSEVLTQDDLFQSLEQKLPKDVTFVEFLRADYFLSDRDNESKEDKRVPAYVAYILRNTEEGLQAQLVQFQDADVIDLAIQAWNENVLERPIPHPTATRGGKAKNRKRKFPKSLGKPENYLSKNVWAKLEPHISECTKLVLCPDSYLSNLPWNYLPKQKSQDLLIDEYEISYSANMLMVLESLNRKPIEGGNCLAIGDIDYGEVAQVDLDEFEVADEVTRGKLAISNFQPLNTKMDLKVAQEYFTKPDQLTLITGNEATEKRLLEAMPKYRYLLIGTHGFALPNATEVLGSSGIVLTGANQFFAAAQRDGDFTTVDSGVFDTFITGTEISCVNLENTELIVLSACDCGQGHILDGEAVFGIQSAYITSGARSTVTSLYRVSDDAAPKVLDEFLNQHLRKGKAKSAALRLAQLQLKSEGVPAKYWVYWTLNGDWR